jgi:hypothetical protein
MMRKNLLAAIAALAVMAVVVAIALLASRGSEAPSRTVSQLPAGDSGSDATEPGDQPTRSGWNDQATDPSGTRGGSTVPGYPGQIGGGSSGWPGSAPSTDPGGPMLPVHPGNGGQQPNTIAIADAHLDAQGHLVLGYFVGLPGCYAQLDHVDLVETAAKVTVTLVLGPDPQVPADTACPDIAMGKSAQVTLTSPLGGRTVVDGSTGDPVPVS